MALSKSYFSPSGSSPLVCITIGELIDRAAEKYGDLDGLICSDINLRRTFSELKLEIDDLAGGFLSFGLRRGDRVACFGPNSHPFYLAQMAIWKAGLIFIPLHQNTQTNELLHCLKKMEVQCLLIADSHNCYKRIVQLIPEILKHKSGLIQSSVIPSLTTVITMGISDLKGLFTLSEIIKLGNHPESKKKLQEAVRLTDFDDICTLLLTSGTTGLPKGVMLSHYNIVNNSFYIGERLGFTDKDKICLPISLTHFFGNVIGTLLALQFGITSVFPSPEFSPKACLEAIQKEKCTVIYSTPPMHILILNVLKLGNYDMTSLRIACIGASVCPEPLIMEMKINYGIDKIGNIYGLTETGISFLGFPNDNNQLLSTTVGFVMDHFEVKVVDLNGKIVPCGEPGEMCVRGYGITQGYWNDPKKTAEVKRKSNWFHTGDQMILHENGYTSIIGRFSDCINVGGEKVYPKEVEDILNTNSKIMEAHVFGVPTGSLGQVVATWIRLKDGEVMREENVTQFCTGKIAVWKIPCHIFFVDDFPKTRSGKISKIQMKDHPITKRRIQNSNSELTIE